MARSVLLIVAALMCSVFPARAQNGPDASAVALERVSGTLLIDGVINEDSDEYIKTPQEWIPVPGSLEAIARLHRANWHIVVATNQSGIARRLYDLDTLARIHVKMHRAVREAG